MNNFMFWFFVFLGWTAISSIYSLVLAKKGEIIVFYDFTDAAMSFATFLVPVALLIIGVQLGINSTISLILGGAVFVYFAWNMNKIVVELNPSKAFFPKFMILSAKLLLPLLLILHLLPSEGQRKDETKVAYELRLKREQSRDAMWIAIISGIIFFMIEEKNFSSIPEWFNFQKENDKEIEIDDK